MSNDKFITVITAGTPTMSESISYMDADDELQEIANKIKGNTPHNSELKVDRIKFMYTNKAKKEGGKYVVGELMARNEKERAVYDAYDYVLLVYYPIWKNLDDETKFIQLDRLLCGVDIEVKKTGEEAIKKSAPDCREYIENMHYWGADKVLRSSEVIDLAIIQHMDDVKSKKQNG